MHDKNEVIAELVKLILVWDRAENWPLARAILEMRVKQLADQLLNMGEK
jgi:hypothetical protein